MSNQKLLNIVYQYKVKYQDHPNYNCLIPIENYLLHTKPINFTKDNFINFIKIKFSNIEFIPNLIHDLCDE